MAHAFLADLGLGPYIHDTPSRRFPVYTRGNAGEVYPEVVFPFTNSLVRNYAADPIADAIAATGALRASEVAAEPEAALGGGVFYGYSYLNLSISRVIAVRAPGIDIADADRNYLGSEAAAPPHRPHPRDRNLWCSLRMVAHTIGVLRTRAVPELAADEVLVERWREALPPPASASDDRLIGTLVHGMPLMMRLFRRHLDVSASAASAHLMLMRICTDALGDGSLALAMLGGIGDVASAEPARALWALSRLDPGSRQHAVELERFLAVHGCRGPNEWEIACPTWGTRPEMALALVDSLRRASDDQHPACRLEKIAAEREVAIATARAEMRGVRRKVFDATLRAATLFAQARERAKTTVVRALHEGRLAGDELGRRLGARASSGRADDLWFVLWDELAEYRRDPGALASRIEARRQTRAALAELEPPFVFDTELPPPSTWRRRDGAPEPAAAGGSVLSGIAGASGTVTGIARIVRDPSEVTDLGPGTVLVAPHTDPAWTPLFLAVDGVVVDVGGQMSHAVIVARELGLPCVVAVDRATQRIGDGTTITVDGSAGTVVVHG